MKEDKAIPVIVILEILLAIAFITAIYAAVTLWSTPPLLVVRLLLILGIVTCTVGLFINTIMLKDSLN